MRMVDAAEMAGEVLPRKWVRWASMSLVLGMVVTGNFTPVVWFVTEKAVAIQEDVMQPMLRSLIASLPAPARTP